MSKYNFCNFSQAKILKEKGFSWKPHYIEQLNDYIIGYIDYQDLEDGDVVITEFPYEDHVRENNYLRPELTDVIDWIFDKYGTWIYVYCNETGYFAHSLECKYKYDTPHEAMSEGIDLFFNSLE